MIHLITGFSLLFNIILTVVAVIRGWKWRAILPMSGAVLTTVMLAVASGLFIGSIFSDGFLSIFVGIINILCQSAATAILIFMMKYDPSHENISLLKQKVSRVTNKIKFKKLGYFFGIAILCWVILCFLAGFLGIEVAGGGFNFLFIISSIISVLFLRALSKRKDMHKMLHN